MSSSLEIADTAGKCLTREFHDDRRVRGEANVELENDPSIAIFGGPAVLAMIVTL